MHLYITPTKTFLSCQVCGGLLFGRRAIKMNSTAMTFFDLSPLKSTAIPNALMLSPASAAAS